MPGEQVGSAYAKISLDAKELDSGMNAAHGRFSGFVDGLTGKASSGGKAIGTALAAGAVAAGVALAGVATIGVKSYMDIESAAADAASKMDLAEIAEKNGTTVAASFDNIKEHVIAVSRELGQLNTNAFDPTQIATALAGLAAGGFDVASASAANLSPILSLATATSYDLADSAKLAMSTLNQFGMGVDQLGRVSDVYTLASGKSAAGMKDFDYAMQQAGPVAQGVGMSFEELTARISKLADAGYSGEKSGTALRTAFMALTSPTKTQTDTLAKLGLTFDDVNPRQHTFSETMDLLLSKGADIYDFGEIYGKEGAAIVYSTAKQNEAVKGLTTELVNSKGAAEQMAKMMLDTLKGSFDAAMGAATDLAIGIGQDLAPTIKGLLDWFSATGAPAIRELYAAFKDGDWGKIGDTIASAVKAGWAKLKDIGKTLFDWIKGVNWSGLGEYVVKGIKAAWNELMSLGGQLLSALVAVDWGSVGTAIWNGIVAIGQWWVDFWSGLYDDVVSIDWGGIWDSLVDAWDTAIAKLSDVGSTILGYFDAIDWGTVGFKIGQAIRDAIKALSDIGSTVWNYLTSADWSGAGNSISEKIKGGLEKLKEFWTEFKAGLSSVDFATAGKEIGDKIKAGLGQITDYAKSIYDKIKTGWDSWIAADGPKKLGESFAHSLVKGVVDLGKWIYDKIADYWKSNSSSIGSNFSALFHSAIDFGKTALKAAYDFVTGFANTVLTAGKGTIGAAILDVIGDAMDSAWEGAGTSLHTAATEWRKDAESIWEASDFDTTIAVTKDWLDGDPLPTDGETRSVTYAVSTTGEDITAKVNAIPGTTGASGTGKASGYWSGGKYYLTSSTGGVSASAWAHQMGESGASFSSTQAKLREAQTSGATLTASDMESIMAAFTAGQEEYDAAHKTAAEEAAEVTTAAAEEAAETTTEAAEEAASTTTGAADDAAATEKAAAQSLYQTLVGGSQAAANAIKIGAEIAAGSVKIGLNSAGQEIAIIGQVAQQRFAEAGGILYDKVQVAGSGFSAAIGGAATALSSRISVAVQNLSGKIDLSGGNFQSKVDISGSNFKVNTGGAVTNLASKLGLGASDLLSKSYNAGSALLSGANSAKSSMTSGGSSAGSALSAGASALRSAASSIGSALSSFTGGSLSWGNYFAEGTVTSGPQMAVIGEDGPAHPEFVIPTKTKRWDLLLAAMKAYGLKGFAEGTSTGTATTATATATGEEASGMTATFGITGLSSMSKQVQKIINNLKDFFRISWGIIKAEGSTYWSQINTALTAEITAIRDNAWQAAIDIRNVWIASNAEIKTDALAFWAAYWAGIEPSVTSLKSSLVSAFQSMGSDAKSAIDNMVLNSESSLQSFESAWSDIWAQLVSDMNDAQAKISEGISTISDALKKISVNVNINANISSGGSSGGSYSGSNAGEYGEWSPTDGGWLQGTGDMGSTYNISTGGGGCAIGTNCASGGCPDYMTAVQSSTGSLATAGLGYTGGTYESRASSYTLPAIFAAKGALVDQPTKAILAEAGPEMVLPTKLTKMFLSLADMGFGQGGRSASERIVIEDHTEHHWYMDSKEVTDALMTRVMKKMQLKGAVSAR